MADLTFDNIRITASSCKLDFKQARRLAEQVIWGTVRAPRLIAWRDSKKHSGEVMNENGSSLSQNSKVRVDINNDEYSFIFAESE